MPDNVHPKRLTRSRTTPLFAAVLVGAVVAAGCGGASGTPTGATSARASTPASSGASVGAATTAGSSGASGGGTGNSASTAPDGYGSGSLAFARCMRANGVPNFPDPQPGGGAVFNPAGINTGAPAVQSAMAKCQKLTEAGAGPAALGSTTHPSAQTLTKLLDIAHCMRSNGVSEFPDPRTSVPLHPFGSGTGLITDYDGAILLFPSTLDTHAPAYTKAAAACGTLAEKLGTGPHG
jgi:hypothetical protein